MDKIERYIHRDMLLQEIKRNFDLKEKYTGQQFLDLAREMPMRRATVLAFKEQVQCKNCVFSEKITHVSGDKTYNFLICLLGTGIVVKPDSSCNEGVDREEIDVSK